MTTFLLLLLALCIGLAVGYFFGRQQLSVLEAAHRKQIEQLERNNAEHRNNQQRQFEQQINLLKEQLQNSSERVLRERSEQLSATNREQLAAILQPLQSGLKQMQDAVEKSDREHQNTISRLDESIKTTLQQTQIIGERADRLASALTAENKVQGDFGELRLRTLLENMGLQEGTQFEEQTALRDEKGRAVKSEDEGKRLIPDIILHFPDERDVIIDSKMSITAFEKYHNATTDAERNEALKQHITSVRNHVNELSKKSYAAYIRKGRQRLDFVVMYMFSESALQLALTTDPSLWKEAYDKSVFITGSQNLYALLRVLEMAWTHQRQVENQQRIIEQANTIVSRVQLFFTRYNKVEEMLDKTRTAFKDLHTLVAPTGKSITKAANDLVALGAQEDRKRKDALPKNSNEEIPFEINNLSLEKTE